MIKRTLQWILHWLRKLCVRRSFQKSTPSTAYIASSSYSGAQPKSSRSKIVKQLNRALYSNSYHRNQQYSACSPSVTPIHNGTSTVGISTVVGEPYADHPDKIAALADVAYLCERQGRLVESEHLYRRLIILKQHRFGKAHLSTAESMSDLALLYRAQKRHSEAQPLLEQTLKIQQQLLSANHAQICETLHQLADTFCQQQQYKRAEALYQQAITALHMRLGPQHPQSQTVYAGFIAMLRTAIESDHGDALSMGLLSKDIDHLNEIHPLTDSWLHRYQPPFKQ